MKIKFNKDILYFISLFEKVTKAKIKDCFEEENKLYFIVQHGEIGKAIGKNAINVKKLQNIINRKIKIVEFYPETIGFIKNYIYPIRVKEIQEKEGIFIIIVNDSQSRGLLIGRNATNLRELEKIVKRYFNIIEIKVEQNG